jgi:hypothetical protein
MRRGHRGVLEIVTGVVISMASCASSPDQDLAGRISAAAQASDVGVVNVPAVAPFAWDRFFVFPPYATSSTVAKELGSSWSGSARIEMRDDIALLVFVDQGRVVRFVEQPRRSGDFSECHRPGGFARSEAVFRCAKGATCTHGAG